MSPSASELGCFHSVPENLVVAAVDRAQRHGSKRADPVPLNRIVEHLGFVPSAHTTRRMNTLLRALVRAGVLEYSRALSREQWALTSSGRTRLRRARRSEELELPESPQHPEWRHKHARAVEGIGAYRERVREALKQAAELLDDEQADSEAWRAMAGRLQVRSGLLCSAIFCLRESEEPDDAQRDADDSRTVDDRRRSLRHWNEDA